MANMPSAWSDWSDPTATWVEPDLNAGVSDWTEWAETTTWAVPSASVVQYWDGAQLIDVVSVQYWNGTTLSDLPIGTPDPNDTGIHIWDGNDLIPAVPATNRDVEGPDTPPVTGSAWTDWSTAVTWSSTGSDFTPLMGVYLGNHNENPDGNYRNQVGVYPDMSTQYYQSYQSPGWQINKNAENLKLSRGIIPNMTVSMVGGPYTHAQVAAGAADGWIDYWAQGLADLDPGEIWFTFDHEFEVKRNHSLFGWTATDQQYADAWNRWKTAIKAARPTVKFTYWYGYARQSEIDSIGSKLDDPDMIAFDPYVFSHHAPSTTFEEMVNPKLNWLKARSWYNGQPVYLAEYAKDKVHGDQQCANFYTNLRPRMAALGLHGAVLFCRDKTGYGAVQANVLTTSNFPLSKTAYSNSAKAGN